MYNIKLEKTQLNDNNIREFCLHVLVFFFHY